METGAQMGRDDKMMGNLAAAAAAKTKTETKTIFGENEKQKENEIPPPFNFFSQKFQKLSKKVIILRK